MAIVLTSGRPALPIQGGTFASPPGEWSDLEAYRANLEAAIAATGRMEMEGHPYLTWVGTAFLVGPGRVLTARNLAETYADGRGDAGLQLKPGLDVAFTMKPEFGARLNLRLKVTSVRFIHPFYEVALCELDAGAMVTAASRAQAGEPPLVSQLKGLTLAANPPKKPAGRKVAVISFAAADPRNAPDATKAIYGEVLNTLYLQPGQVRERTTSDDGEILIHDCSTLNGSSGAPVIDLETGQVLGLHFGGRYLVGNNAVPAWELARDPRVRQHGVNFSDDPPWMYQWTQAEWLSQKGQVPVAPVKTQEDAAPPDQDREVEHLTLSELHEVYSLLLKAGLASPDRQPGLFVGMNMTYVATLPTGSSADTRLLLVLDTLNRTDRLTDRELPFETFLLNAVEVAKPRPESGKLDGYLKELRNRAS